MSCLRYTRDPDACSRDLVAAIDGDEHRGQRLSRGGIRDRAGIEAAQSVAPKAAATAARLLRELAQAGRTDEGNQRFEILERIAPVNQFVIVAIWNDLKAYEAGRIEQ